MNDPFLLLRHICRLKSAILNTLKSLNHLYLCVRSIFVFEIKISHQVWKDTYSEKDQCSQGQERNDLSEKLVQHASVNRTD